MTDNERDELLQRLHLELTDNTRKTEKILEGFPGGDTDGHRRYHQAVIERMEQRNKIVADLLARAIQAGFFGGVGLLGLAAWHYFKLSVNQ